MSDLKVTQEIREQEENEAALNPESEVEAAVEAQAAAPDQMDPSALMGRFIDPNQVQQATQNVQQGVQNIQAGAPDWIEQNVQTPLGAYMKGRTVEEEQAWRDSEKVKAQEANEQFQAQMTDPLSEGIRAATAGTMDAVDSVTQFGELTGDTLKLGLNSVLGKPTDDTQNPFHQDYVHRDLNWLDIPENFKPENRTAIGKFARGMVEFGLLVRWTGAVAKGSGLSQVGQTVPVLRSANTAIAGNKYLKFIDKGAKIFAEGAVADLISSSSEAGNIANLASEHVPWLAPDIMNALAVRPEDNPWLARIKTVTAGGGMNHVGHVIGAFGKGLWRYADDIKAGRNVDEARANANKVYQEDLAENLRADETAATEMAAQDYINGDGIGRADRKREYLLKHLSEEDNIRYDDPITDAPTKQELENLASETGKTGGDIWDNDAYISSAEVAQKRKPSPFVNPEQFNGPERATYRKGLVRQNVQESLADIKKGGDGKSYTPIASESQIRAISKGNASIRDYVKEVADDVADLAFKDLDNRLDWKDIKTLIIRQADPLFDALDDAVQGKGGKDLAKTFEEALKDPNNKRVYIDDGQAIVTTTPAVKGANVLVLRSLARLVSDIATGARSIQDGVHVGRQADMVFDAMKVLLKENKKMGMMWGLDGKAQQWGYKLPKTIAEQTKKRLNQLDGEIDEFIEQARMLKKADRWEDLASLFELNQLSDGHVRTMDHISEFLRAKWRGGRMDDVHIKGMTRMQLQGTFFNSILGGLKTIRKAVIGTNTIAIMRPFQALVGTRLPWVKMDEKEAALAVVQIQSMARGWGEAWQMAKRNWELGISKKNLDYHQKYDFEADLQEWKMLAPYYEKYGSPVQQAAYGHLDRIVDFNTNPWVKYSQNAMGAGDAFARTLIGRQRMAMKAGIDALEKGVNPNDLKKFVTESEDGFRNSIFDKNRDGFYVVKDKAASMAGDEAAMTKGLEENFKGFESIANIPGMKLFFPLVRPGFNYLDLVFQHTSINRLRDKWFDLVDHPSKTGQPPSQLLLDKYGLQPEEVAQEAALMRGRMAMGDTIVLMGFFAGANGMMTGTMPYDAKQREHWKNNKIQPNSFKFGNTYVPFIDNMAVPEVFAPLMTMTANVFAYQDVLGEKATEEWRQKLTWIAASMIVDQSMLSGIGDLAVLMDPYASSERATNYIAARAIRSHIPFSSISRELAEVVDSTQREANTLWEMIIKSDVGLKSIVPVKYDVLSKDRSGKELVYGPENGLLKLWNTLSPVAVVPTDDDEVRSLLKEMNFNLPEVLSELGGIELNSVERSELQKLLSMPGPKGAGVLGQDLRADLEYYMTGGGSEAFKKSLKEYRDAGLKVGDGYDLKKADFYRIVYDVFQQHKQRVKAELRANPKFSKLARKIEIQEEKNWMLKTGVTQERKQRIDQKERLINYATNP